jgi:hypothetical protein
MHNISTITAYSTILAERKSLSGYVDDMKYLARILLKKIKNTKLQSTNFRRIITILLREKLEEFKGAF